MENKKKSSAKDRLNAKQAKKIGKQQREYIPYDWALIFQANGRNMARTAKALDISRYTLIRYLKGDEEVRNSFDDVKLNEIDDVRSELVKLALSGHYPAIRYYLENAGGFNGFGAKADGDDSDSEDGGGYSAQILESMTLQEKADAYEAMLAEDNRKRSSK